jgi:hypothetical protein
VRLYIERRAEHQEESLAASIRQVASVAGMSADMLRGWSRAAEVDAGTRPGITSYMAAELRRMRRRTRSCGAWRSSPTPRHRTIHHSRAGSPLRCRLAVHLDRVDGAVAPGRHRRIDRGLAGRPSRSPGCDGCIGATTTGFTHRSDTGPRSSTKPNTITTTPRKPCPRELEASTQPSAIH